MQEPPAAPSPPLTGFDRFIDRLKNLGAWLERVAPGHRAREMGKQEAVVLELHHGKFDEIDNQESSPPPDERVRLHCLWVIEFFPPSRRAALIEGLKDLGWDKPEDLSAVSPVAWVQDIRKHFGVRGWLGLGPIARHGDPGYLMSIRRAPLPDGVSLAFGSIHHLLPSVTAVVMQFMVDEKDTTTYEDTLRRVYATEVKRSQTGKSFQLLDPPHRKRHAIQATRHALRHRCGQWFRERLPGAFSIHASDEEFPTCEFLTTTEAEPFTASLESGFESYARLLDIIGTFDVWECDRYPALRLAWRTFEPGQVRHLLLTANETRLREQEKDLHVKGSVGRSFIGRQLEVDTWLVRWALVELVGLCANQIVTLRDRAFEALSRKTTSRSLKQIQGELLRLRPDTLPIIHDLETMDGYGGLARGSEYKFTPVDTKWGGTKELVAALSEDLARQATTMRQALADVTENLTVGTDILSSRANLKLQRWIVAMTVAILVLTGLLAYVALSPNRKRPMAPPASEPVSPGIGWLMNTSAGGGRTSG
jgi:hypothetical protein